MRTRPVMTAHCSLQTLDLSPGPSHMQHALPVDNLAPRSVMGDQKGLIGYDVATGKKLWEKQLYGG